MKCSTIHNNPLLFIYFFEQDIAVLWIIFIYLICFDNIIICCYFFFIIDAMVVYYTDKIFEL
jgi:hypothetical protein